MGTLILTDPHTPLMPPFPPRSLCLCGLHCSCYTGVQEPSRIAAEDSDWPLEKPQAARKRKHSLRSSSQLGRGRLWEGPLGRPGPRLEASPSAGLMPPQPRPHPSGRAVPRSQQEEAHLLSLLLTRLYFHFRQSRQTSLLPLVSFRVGPVKKAAMLCLLWERA